MNSLLNISASVLAVLVGLCAVAGRSRSWSSWFFFGGILALAAANVVDGAPALLGGAPTTTDRVTLSLIVGSFLPGLWLAFSLTYARGNARDFLFGWRYILAAAFVVPPTIALTFRAKLLALSPG